MKKKLLALILAALTTLSVFAIPALAAESSPALTVTVEGEAVNFPDQKPVVKNNRTIVPIRFIAEALGYEVDWNPTDNTAVIDNGRIKLQIGTDKAEIDGSPVTLDVGSELINDRTMVPIRIVAETLGCTVDWFAANNKVVINKRNSNGTEMSVFERFKQSGLFWNYRTTENEYLVWKDNYRTLAEASDPSNYDAWWIEQPTDKSTLTNQSFDCAVIMKTFGKDELAQVKDLFYTIYPTNVDGAYNILMQTVKGELWQTFYEETSELYPLYSAMPAFSGTFGSVYYDNREVKMLCNSTCTQLVIHISDDGYENPDIPRTLTQEETDFYTAQAKNRYCLELWGLN